MGSEYTGLASLGLDLRTISPSQAPATASLIPVPTSESASSEVTMSYFDKLPPTTQSAIKKLMGIGISFFIARLIVNSPDVQYFLNKAVNCIRRKKIPLLSPNSIIQGDSAPNLLIDIPGKVRCHVWSFLSAEDLKNIRLLCKRFQFEVDHRIGVNGIIDSRCPTQFNWFSSVAIRSCFVDYLENLSDLDWLARPKLLTSLTLHDLCPITPKILQRILSICNNIRSLSAHFPDDEFSNHQTNMQILRIISNFQNQSHHAHVVALGFLTVTYNPDKRTSHWVVKFKKQAEKIKIEKDELELGDVADKPIKKTDSGKSVSVMKYPNAIKCLHLNFERYAANTDDGHGMSISYSRHRHFWRNFLDLQKNLHVIVCDFGPVCWEVYEQVVRRNSQSIQKICFANICCWESSLMKGVRGHHFDWNFFSTCPQLAHLAVKAEIGPRFGPRNFIPVSPAFPMHLKVLHCNFGLVYWGFYMSIVIANANTLEDVSLLRLTIWDKSHSAEHPFDWNTFSQCRALKRIEIGGEDSIFLRTINFSSFQVPSPGLKMFELHWVALTSAEVTQMIHSMPNLENTFEFLDSCSIDNFYREESPKNIVKRLRPHAGWVNKLMRVMDVLAVMPLQEIAGTTWLWFA